MQEQVKTSMREIGVIVCIRNVLIYSIIENVYKMNDLVQNTLFFVALVVYIESSRKVTIIRFPIHSMG